MQRMRWVSLIIFQLLLVNPLQLHAEKMIELVLDSSGSMEAKLPDGETRINAARKAVDQLTGGLSADTVLALRVYGHQSPKQKHDCNDIQLVVPFGKLSDVKNSISTKVNQLQPQGYTPITKALEQAAGDFKSGSENSQTIILVSDGKETCEGDPCVTARKLSSSGVKLVIHTVGLGVDSATRSQLQCIANATGGSYFDAKGTNDLASALNEASKTEKVTVEIDTGTGFLEIPNAGLHIHKVIDASTGKQVAEIHLSKKKVELPASIYNVTFEGDVWKSIEVKPGETTVLSPGKLVIDAIRGTRLHKVINSETGKEYGTLALGSSSILLVPGTYEVTFSETVWPSIQVDAGKDTIIRPGAVSVKGGPLIHPDYKIHTAEGKQVAALEAGKTIVALPLGQYTIDIAGKKQPFTIEEGKLVEFTVSK